MHGGVIIWDGFSGSESTALNPQKMTNENTHFSILCQECSLAIPQDFPHLVRTK